MRVRSLPRLWFLIICLSIALPAAAEGTAVIQTLYAASPRRTAFL
jgi:hypothetical protein